MMSCGELSPLIRRFHIPHNLHSHMPSLVHNHQYVCRHRGKAIFFRYVFILEKSPFLANILDTDLVAMKVVSKPL